MALVEPAYQDEFAKIYLGKDLDVLPLIDDGSVDLAVYSPPYNLSNRSGFAAAGQKAGKWSGGALAHGYGAHDDDMDHDDYVEWQREVLRVVWSKLTDTGAIFLNHKPRHIDKNLWLPTDLNPGLPLRDLIVWDRGGGVNCSPSHFCSSSEWILVFAKPGWSLRDRAMSNRFCGGNVWRIAPVHDSPHPAPFPEEIPSWAIQASANVRTVLDPYVGSGTTLRAAKDLGVRGIGIDSDPQCVAWAAERLAQESLFAPEPAVSQPSLL